MPTLEYRTTAHNRKIQLNLGLGTVQFGLDYGISNPGGKTPPLEVAAILRMALASGIDLLDTAPAYGDSEQVLGTSLAAIAKPRIVTKTPQFNTSTVKAADARRLTEAFAISLKNLRVPSVHGLLVHRVEDLFLPEGHRLFDAMLELRARKLVQKIGASVYSGSQIERALERFDFDLIQLPMNVLDQRLATGDILPALKLRGIEVHARSAFLQGVLLQTPSALPQRFNPIKALLTTYHDWLAGNGLSPAQGALAFMRRQAHVDCTIIGVATANQLSEILAAWQHPIPTEMDFRVFACADAHYIDPRLWT